MKTTLRAIDANLNRVCEGLRVIEDIARFIISESNLQQQLKTMRHDVRQLVIGDNALLHHRNVATDVGFESRGKLELRRGGHKDLIWANCKRIQEGLRTLEELFKLENTAMAAKIKSMRYQSYEIECSLWMRLDKKKLHRGLYLILTDPPGGYSDLTKLVVRAELPAVQLRYKGDDDRRLLDLASRMRKITRDSETLFIINDRPDIALMVGADGVHVGQEDLPVRDVRRLIGPKMLLGLSTHNLDQVLEANDEPVDYIGFGPLYPTTSKAKPDPVIGPEMLIKARQLAKHPITAIGGLTEQRIEKLMPDTFHNLAVITAVTRAQDPLQAMQTIHQRALGSTER